MHEKGFHWKSYLTIYEGFDGQRKWVRKNHSAMFKRTELN